MKKTDLELEEEHSTFSQDLENLGETELKSD